MEVLEKGRRVVAVDNIIKVTLKTLDHVRQLCHRMLLDLLLCK